MLPLFFLCIAIASFFDGICSNTLPFDFGSNYGDSTLPKIEGTKLAINLTTTPMKFLDQTFQTVYIDEDGAIWLGWHCDDTCPVPADQFPVQSGKQMVACYWADVDNSISGSQVYYRLATDSISWTKAKSYLQKATGGQPIFDYTSTEKLLLIVTWSNVTYYGGNAQTPSNTFQCALMSDGKNSYGLLAYQTLNWYISPDQANPALVGIDTGNAAFENLVLPYSGTRSVVELTTYTNFRTRTTYNQGPKGWNLLTECSPTLPSYYPLPPTTIYKTCTISGDPHYYTFDGEHLDQAFGGQPNGYQYGVTNYQLPGDYILMATADCHSTTWPPVSIVGHIEPSNKGAPPNERTISAIFGVTVTFYWNLASASLARGSIVVNLRENFFKVGEEVYTGTYNCPTKSCGNYSFSVQPINLGFQLDTTFGLTLVFDYSSSTFPYLSIKLPDIESINGNIFGNCGNMDGNPTNDNFCYDAKLETFESYDNCWSSTYLETHQSASKNGYFSCPYANSNNSSSLNKKYKLKTKLKNNLPKQKFSKDISECNVLIDSNGIFSQCQGVPNINSIYNGCVLDLTTTNGDTTVLCQYAKQLAVECINMPGVINLNWRSTTFCPLTCPSNSHYSNKFSSCTDTCCDPYAQQFCSGYYTEGCECNTGFLSFNDQCVTSAQCKGCLDDQGNMVTVNSTWLTMDCSKWCTCLASGETTCTQAGCCSTHSACISNGTSATCVCTDGYYGDGFFCSYNDHCINNICENDATCVTIATGYECICPPGFTGQFCQTPINFCQPNPCIHGKCINQETKYTCNCSNAFTGNNCDIPVDYCASFPCKNLATCNSTINGYNCACREGFSGINCDELFPTESTIYSTPQSYYNYTTTEIRKNYTIIFTSSVTPFSDPCISNQCQHSSTCIPVNSTAYVCECPPLYAGCFCEHQIDPCNPDPCEHGICEHVGYGYNCKCVSGWFGQNCTRQDFCYSNPCLNNGTCINEQHEYHCFCPDGYSGVNCDKRITTTQAPDFCDSNPCQHNGTCYPEPDGYICFCQKEWAGCNCQYHMPSSTQTPTTEAIQSTTAAKDACLSNPCQNNGTCYDNPGGYNCHCPTNYFGDNCQFLATTEKHQTTTPEQQTTTLGDPCDSNPCQHTGTCIPKFEGGYICICTPEYLGDNCQYPVTTTVTPTPTTTINFCLSNPCLHNGTCYYSSLGYKCKCEVGYTGNNCEDIATTVVYTTFGNPCMSNPCEHMGTCRPFSNGTYVCRCTPDYGGPNCQYLITTTAEPMTTTQGYSDDNPYLYGCTSNSQCNNTGNTCVMRGLSGSQYGCCYCLTTGDSCKMNEDCCSNVCTSGRCTGYGIQGSYCEPADTKFDLCSAGCVCQPWGTTMGYCNCVDQTTTSIEPVSTVATDDNPYLYGCTSNSQCNNTGNTCMMRGLSGSQYGCCYCLTTGDSCKMNEDCCSNVCTSGRCTGYGIQGSYCEPADTKFDLCSAGCVCQPWGTTMGYCNCVDQTTTSIEPVSTVATDNNPYLYGCTSNSQCNNTGNMCMMRGLSGSQYGCCYCLTTGDSCKMNEDCCSNVCTSGRCTGYGIQGSYCEPADTKFDLCSAGCVCQPWGTTMGYCNCVDQTTTSIEPVSTVATDDNPYLYGCTSNSQCNNTGNMCMMRGLSGSQYGCCYCLTTGDSCKMNEDCCSNVCTSGRCTGYGIQGSYCEPADTKFDLCSAGCVCQPWGTTMGYCNCVDQTTTSIEPVSTVATDDNPYLYGCTSNSQCNNTGNMCMMRGLSGSQYGCCYCLTTGDSCKMNEDCCSNVCTSGRCTGYGIQGSYCEPADTKFDLCSAGCVCQPWGTTMGYCNCVDQTTTSIEPVSTVATDDNPYLYGCTSNSQCNNTGNTCMMRGLSGSQYGCCYCLTTGDSCKMNEDCCSNVCTSGRCTGYGIQGSYCEPADTKFDLCSAGCVCQPWGTTMGYCNCVDQTTTSIEPVSTVATDDNPYLYGCTSNSQCNNTGNMCMMRGLSGSQYGCCYCLTTGDSCKMNEDCCSNVCTSGRCTGYGIQGSYCEPADTKFDLCSAGCVCQPWGTTMGYCNCVDQTTTSIEPVSTVATDDNPYLYGCTSNSQCNNTGNMCMMRGLSGSQYGCCYCLTTGDSCKMNEDCCSNVCTSGRCTGYGIQGSYCEPADTKFDLCSAGCVCQPWGTTMGYCNCVGQKH